MKIFLILIFIFTQSNISSAELISKGKLRNIISKVKNYIIPSNQLSQLYNNFVRVTKNVINDEELVMFLAQMMYESDGFRYSEDQNCKYIKNCHGDYFQPWLGVRDISYHGRGYLSICWASNYQEASKAILRDSYELLRKPDRVVDEPYLSMAVSAWYWRTYISPELEKTKFKQYKFGISTKIISKMRGTGECVWQKQNDEADKRYKLYQEIFKETALFVGNRALPNGCYN